MVRCFPFKHYLYEVEKYNDNVKKAMKKEPTFSLMFTQSSPPHFPNSPPRPPLLPCNRRGLCQMPIPLSDFREGDRGDELKKQGMVNLLFLLGKFHFFS